MDNKLDLTKFSTGKEIESLKLNFNISDFTKNIIQNSMVESPKLNMANIKLRDNGVEELRELVELNQRYIKELENANIKINALQTIVEKLDRGNKFGLTKGIVIGIIGSAVGVLFTIIASKYGFL